MNTYFFKTEQTVDRTLQEVFEFFKTPENLEKITPPSLGFKILTPGPIQMEKGRLIDYTIKIFGIRQRWTTLITTYEPPHRFVDEQLKGPYSLWHHTHRFQPCETGTKIIDEIKYAMPLGWIGDMAHGFFVKRPLDAIFQYRRKVIESCFLRPDPTGKV